MRELNTDIVIVGAGIAGLWMLNSLTKQGFDVLLLEADSIGGGQSIRSQGIIHGGMKYALNGVLSQASDAIKEMPARWKQCLAGEGDIDLSDVTTLSSAHYLWSQRSLGAKITSFFAKKSMSGRVDSVANADYPAVFQHPEFKGNLYKLNEIVLDTPSVFKQLTYKLAARILKVDTKNCQWHRDSAQNITGLICEQQQLNINAQRFIFAAGEGNGAILDALNITALQMQLRPLHMAVVTHRTNLPIYAHCIGASSKPLVTITHHINADGSFTWYYGGNIAETGVERDTLQQIGAAQALTEKLLPWVTLEAPQWTSLRVNRAEPKQSSLSRPDCAYLHSEGNYVVAWPTKLALAPDLSDKVIALFKQQQLTPKNMIPNSSLSELSHPEIAIPAWGDSNA
ncbi:MAG: glycerol-3-phosphate dehydrogenase [Oceanospirillaceae bacterium]|jgi:glycerol-3-phosphate dehydrogenase